MRSPTDIRQVRTIAAFLRTGISTVAEVGADHLSVSRIAAAAGASRPTFYSYFGDIDGLFADIWLDRGPAFLDWLTTRGVSFETETDDKRAELTAMTEILAVSHRIPELAEVVQPMVDQWWTRVTGKSDYLALKVAMQVSARLGIILTYAVDRRVVLAKVGERFLDSLDDAPQSTNPLPSLDLPDISDPVTHDGTLEDELIDSAARVIASSGVPAASMTRIARGAKVTTGAAYPRFASTQELVLAAFDKWITAVTRENFAFADPATATFDPRVYGVLLMAGLQPGRRIWRNFRIETLLEARVDAGLRASVAESLRTTNERVVPTLGPVAASDDDKVGIAYWIHTLGVGLAMLFNAGVPVNRLDFRTIIRDIAANLNASA